MDAPARDYRAELVSLRAQTETDKRIESSTLIQIGNAVIDLAQLIGQKDMRVEGTLLQLRTKCANEINKCKQNPFGSASYSAINVAKMISDMIALVDLYGIETKQQVPPWPDTGRRVVSEPGTEIGFSSTGQPLLEGQQARAQEEFRQVKAELARVQEEFEAYRNAQNDTRRLAQSRAVVDHNERDMITREATLRVEAEWREKLAEERNKLLERLTAEQERVRQLSAQVGELEAGKRKFESLYLELKEQQERRQTREPGYQEFRQLVDSLSHITVPAQLNQFVSKLLDMAARMTAADASLSIEDLDDLDRYVYGSPPAYGVIEPENGARSAEAQDSLDALLLVVALQGRLHQLLVSRGVRPILPRIGDPFNPKLHRCDSADYVWINDQLERHDRIAGVKRMGYRHHDSVWRIAEVKRFVARRVGVPALPPETLPAHGPQGTSNQVGPSLNAEPPTPARDGAVTTAPSVRPQSPAPTVDGVVDELFRN
jgi:molecular chaperone GrpE (heat shock protein)